MDGFWLGAVCGAAAAGAVGLAVLLVLLYAVIVQTGDADARP